MDNGGKVLVPTPGVQVYDWYGHPGGMGSQMWTKRVANGDGFDFTYLPGHYTLVRLVRVKLSNLIS